MAPTSKEDTSGRLLELDAMRGLAALAVVLYHYTGRFQKLYGFDEALPYIFPHGRFGVYFFFIISGFVIFMTLERARGGVDFCVSRFARLYPVYWVSVALTFFVMSYAELPGREVDTTTALVNLTMIPHIFGYRLVDGVYWSLEVELLFYSAMLLIYLSGQLGAIKKIVFVWLIFSMVLFLVRDMLPTDSTALFVIKVVGGLVNAKYAHLFSIGIVFYARKKQGWYKTTDLALFSLSLFSCFVYNGIADMLIVAGFIGVFALFIVGYLRFLTSPVLVFLGSISYSLYLIHQNVGYVFLRFLVPHFDNPFICILLALAASIAIASLLRICVEKPTMLFIRKKYKERAAR